MGNIENFIIYHMSLWTRVRGIFVRYATSQTAPFKNEFHRVCGCCEECSSWGRRFKLETESFIIGRVVDMELHFLVYLSENITKAVDRCGVFWIRGLETASVMWYLYLLVLFRKKMH